MRYQTTLVGALAFLALTACKADGPSVGPDGVTATKFDKFCTMEGLGAPMRATVVLIDAQSISASPAEHFRESNSALFGLVMGIANPDRAIDTGATAPRENITLLIGDSVTGAIKTLFTGCVPGISAEELAARRAAGSDGALTKYFGSDVQSEIQKSREEFQKRLLVALVQAAPGARANVADTFDTSALAKLMHALGPGSSDDKRLRRLFIFTDPMRSIPQKFANYTAARESGFTAGTQVDADLGLSETYIVPSAGPVSALDEAFLSAFMLGSRADLRRVTPFSSDGLAPVPVKVSYYSGEIPLSPDVKSPMELRLATTASGQLVNSWISYSASKGQRSTPVTGNFSCTDSEHCTLRGDPNGGLGQRWRTEAGAAPQALAGGPFGGLRMIEANDNSGRLTGRIFDPVIFVGSAGDLKFEAKKTEGQDRK